MSEHHSYDYAIVRVVPRVDREEFVNAGAIVFCAARGFLEARMELDEARLLVLDPSVDIDAVRANLDGLRRVAAGGADAGPIGRLSPSERFRWLTAPRSTMIQTSRVHTGQCTDLEAVLEHLLRTVVRRPASSP